MRRHRDSVVRTTGQCSAECQVLFSTGAVPGRRVCSQACLSKLSFGLEAGRWLLGGRVYTRQGRSPSAPDQAGRRRVQ